MANNPNIFECVGTRAVEFKGSDGNQVNGLNIFATYEDPQIEGMGVDKFFIASSRMPKLSFIPAVGAYFEVIFNRYGKIADICRVE